LPRRAVRFALRLLRARAGARRIDWRLPL